MIGQSNKYIFFCWGRGEGGKEGLVYLVIQVKTTLSGSVVIHHSNYIQFFLSYTT